MKPLAVSIRSVHIATSQRKNSRRCMIANAVQEQVPYAKFVTVDAQSIRFSDVEAGRRYIYLTPPRAQRALLAWDAGKPIRPFTLRTTLGYTRQMRVRAAGYRPKRRNRKTEKKTRRVMPPFTRKFGLRAMGRVND